MLCKNISNAFLNPTMLMFSWPTMTTMPKNVHVQTLYVKIVNIYNMHYKYSQPPIDFILVMIRFLFTKSVRRAPSTYYWVQLWAEVLVCMYMPWNPFRTTNFLLDYGYLLCAYIIIIITLYSKAHTAVLKCKENLSSLIFSKYFNMTEIVFSFVTILWHIHSYIPLIPQMEWLLLLPFDWFGGGRGGRCFPWSTY